MSPQRTSLLQPFYPALDGLRALAFLAVFTFHYCRTLYPARVFLWGWTGVDEFFLLSGFLITGILFDTRNQPGYFRNFYVRRTLRIFPLYYGIWLLLLLATPLLHTHWNRYNLAMALYAGNLFLPAAQLGLHADPGKILYQSLHNAGSTHSILVDHFWSLCVEEQFYLVWPAVLWFVRSRRALLLVCFSTMAASLAYRVAFAHVFPQKLASMALYYPTYVRCDALLLGSAIALWIRSPSGPRYPLPRKALTPIFAAAVVAFTLGVILEPHPSALPIADPFVCTFGYTLIAIAGGALLLVTLDPKTRLAQTLAWWPLVYLGRLSYGLYVIHEILFPPLAALAPRLAPHHLLWLIPVLGFGLSLGLAILSFRFLEAPFLRLKSVLAPHQGAVDDPPAPGEPVLP